MTTELFSLMLAVVGSSIGGAWMVCQKLADVESALKVHVAEAEAKAEEFDGRLVRLEQRKARR